MEGSPLFFARGGLVFGSPLVGSGYYGDYWSSTVSSSNYAYSLDFGATYVNFNGSGYRYIGVPVRCVAR